ARRPRRERPREQRSLAETRPAGNIDGNIDYRLLAPCGRRTNRPSFDLRGGYLDLIASICRNIVEGADHGSLPERDHGVCRQTVVSENRVLNGQTCLLWFQNAAEFNREING